MQCMPRHVPQRWNYPDRNPWFHDQKALQHGLCHAAAKQCCCLPPIRALAACLAIMPARAYATDPPCFKKATLSTRHCAALSDVKLFPVKSPDKLTLKTFYGGKPRRSFLLVECGPSHGYAHLHAAWQDAGHAMQRRTRLRRATIL